MGPIFFNHQNYLYKRDVWPSRLCLQNTPSASLKKGKTPLTSVLFSNSEA